MLCNPNAQVAAGSNVMAGSFAQARHRGLPFRRQAGKNRRLRGSGSEDAAIRQQGNRVLRIGTQALEGKKKERPIFFDGEPDGPPELLPAERIFDRAGLVRRARNPHRGLRLK